MLRFIDIVIFEWWSLRISIHPMLRFIFSSEIATLQNQIFQYIQCYGSSVFCLVETRDFSQFQYIQCYGSSNGLAIGVMLLVYFNTSNVTVHHMSRLDGSCFFLISIHPMLRFIWMEKFLTMTWSDFNTSNVTVHRRAETAEDRFSEISIHPMLRFIAYPCRT